VAVIAGQQLQLCEIAASGAIKRVHTLGAVPRPLYEMCSWVAFSADGRFLASATTNWDIALWDVGATRRPLRYFQGNTNYFPALAFHPSGKELASAGTDGFLRLWTVSDARLVRTIDGGERLNALAYSPDGHWIAAGTFCLFNPC
jgi:WD40 repeat protein